MAFIWIVIVVQIVIVAVVVVVLKRLLDKELIDAALERMIHAGIPEGVSTVVVKSSGTLNDVVKARVGQALRSRSSTVEIIFQQDASIKGGLIVEMGTQVLDFSIANRLKNFWS